MHRRHPAQILRKSCGIICPHVSGRTGLGEFIESKGNSIPSPEVQETFLAETEGTPAVAEAEVEIETPELVPNPEAPVEGIKAQEQALDPKPEQETKAEPTPDVGQESKPPAAPEPEPAP